MKTYEPRDVAVTARVLRNAIFRLQDRIDSCPFFSTYDRRQAEKEIMDMRFALSRLELRLEQSTCYKHLN